MAKSTKNSSVKLDMAIKKRRYDNRLRALIVSLVVTLASMLGIVSFENFLPSWMLLAVPLFAGSAVFVAFEAALKGDNESAFSALSKRLMSLLIPSLLAMSSWFAIQSLWVYPFDTVTNRFALENLSTAFLVAGASLVLLLSTMQKDRFWITKRQPGSMDEREIAERQKVMEKSYFFAVATGAVTLWAYLGNISAVDEIKRIDVSMSVMPGHYFFPAYSAIILLFSLPMVIAVWQDKKSSKK